MSYNFHSSSLKWTCIKFVCTFYIRLSIVLHKSLIVLKSILGRTFLMVTHVSWSPIFIMVHCHSKYTDYMLTKFGNSMFNFCSTEYFRGQIVNVVEDVTFDAKTLYFYNSHWHNMVILLVRPGSVSIFCYLATVCPRYLLPPKRTTKNIRFLHY